MGRDYVDVWKDDTNIISTHTPAWGVTCAGRSKIYEVYISTHTPAWGVTNQAAVAFGIAAISTHTPAWGVTRQCVGCRWRSDFNSHARVGRDTRFHVSSPFIGISTHTPAWGVTLDVVSKRHKIITRADYPMQNHTISHKIFLFYSFPLRSAPEFQIICGSQPE